MLLCICPFIVHFQFTSLKMTEITMSKSDKGKIGESQMHVPDQLEKGLASTLSNNTTGLDNDTAFSIGTSSLETVRYSPTNDLLDTLTKQQLIERCRWEIKLKEQLVEKLVQLGCQKGIADDRAKSDKKKEKKKKKTKLGCEEKD